MASKNTWMIVTSILSALLVLLMLTLSTSMPNQQKNGFNRNWLPQTIQPLNKLDITIPLNKICGATDNNLYFSIRDPRWVFMLNNTLKKQDTIPLPINPNRELLETNSFEVDSPWIYFFANNLPGYIFGELKGKGSGDLEVRKTKYLFTKAVILSPGRIIIRSFDSTLKKQSFQKIDTETGEIINQSLVIEEQQDGGFGTDGTMQYDSSNNMLVYLQYYQNRYFLLDTNLQLKYTRNTIDTIATNSVKVKQAFIQGKDRLVPANARIMVNKFCSADKGKLFVLSGIKSDNEKASAFKNNSVLDIYDTIRGTYIGSIYIPDVKGEKVRSILVRNSLLVALYKTHISTYKVSI